MKKLFAVLAAIFLLTIMACSSKDDNGTTGGNNTVTGQGTLTLASGDDATKYTVFNSNQSSTPSQSGAFTIAVPTDSQTYTYAISDTGKKVYAAVSTSADGSSITINAQSTAEAMVLLNPLLIPRTSDERIEIINIVRSDAAVKTLAAVIESVYGSVDDPLSDSRISDALTNAVKSVLISWQTSNVSTASVVKQIVRKSSTLACAVVRGASGSSSVQIYPTSSGVDMGALTLANSTGSTLKLELNNVGWGGRTTNVDWVVRIVELDPGKIKWFHGEPQLYNPTDITDIDSLIKTGGYDKTTIIEGTVASRLLKLFVDPFGKLADSINAEIFPDAGINLPHKGVYAVVALSGSSYGDSAEYNSVKNSSWQKTLWNEAAGINIASAAIDVIGVATTFTGSNIDISPVLTVALGTIKTALTNNPNYLNKSGITAYVDLMLDICDKLLDYLRPYIHSSISDLQSSGFETFFHVAVNTAKGVVDVWSGTISASTRLGDYIYNVTPRESGYADLGATPNYTVTYNANTGTGSVPTDNSRYLEGATVTMMGQGTLTKTGYTFGGWNTKVDGTGINYASSSTFLMGTANVVLYAKWTTQTGYTISGTVTSNGTGLAGVTVTLTGIGTSSTVTIDANGVYTFSNAANGSYTLSFSGSGYTFNPSSVSVTVNGTNFTVATDIIATTGGSWVGTKQLGSTGNDEGRSVAVDASGNVYVIGFTNGGLDESINQGMFLVKYDASGTKQWIRQLSGASTNITAHGVAVDASGNVYVTDETDCDLDGNTITGSYGYDMFLVKYNSSGTKQWTRMLGSLPVNGGNGDNGSGVAVDVNGNIYVSGITQGNLDGNTNAGGDFDIFLVKYDASGTKQWTRQLGTSASDESAGVAVDTSGSAYVTGNTNGDLDGNSNAGGYDMFLVKYDASGSKQWTRQLGTSEADWAYDVSVDASGNVYVTGFTNGDFDGNTSEGNPDMFLVKYNSSGEKQWSRQLGTSLGPSYWTSSWGVDVDNSGNVYVTGTTGGNLDGNTSSGYGDIFLVKYNTIGTKQWTRQLGTSSGDYSFGVAADTSGNAFITSYTEGDLDGNTNAGGRDIFLVKYNTNGVKQ